MKFEEQIASVYDMVLSIRFLSKLTSLFHAARPAFILITEMQIK